MRILLGCVLSLAVVGCNQSSTPPAKPVANTPATTSSSGNNRTAEATASQTADRDNTRVNVRDRDKEAKTPLDQNENQSDINITADIRKRVVATKMSVNAQNVKIITQDGLVTLRGPVESDDEKRQIEEIAVAVAGADRVDNQIEINDK